MTSDFEAPQDAVHKSCVHEIDYKITHTSHKYIRLIICMGVFEWLHIHKVYTCKGFDCNQDSHVFFTYQKKSLKNKHIKAYP